MVTLNLYKPRMKLPESDYVVEKQSDLEDILQVLTPKFEGRWEIIVMDAKIKYVKEVLSKDDSPDWLTIHFYLNKAKLNEVIMVHPNFAPREKTRKEVFDELVASMKHLLDESARRALFKALGSNPEELRDVVEKLDKECKGVNISLKDVQSVVNYSKKVYASEVVNAFLLCERNRWKLYEKLVRELGQEYAYNAINKYVRNLLKDKNGYLSNLEVKNRIVSKVDAPLICYAYVIFSNTTNYKQLYCAMYSLENRCTASLRRMIVE